MKKQTLLGVLAGICVSFVHLQTQANQMYGVFMVTKGTVKIQSAKSSAAEAVLAKVGAKVFEGDTVTTAADSRAKIVMSDRNVINVNPDSQVQIAKYQNDPTTGKKDVELNLLQGKVRNNVEQTYDGEKSKFLIKTPTAVAGVRGTQFMAGYDPKTQMTSIVTFKGAVTVASVNPQGVVVGTPVVVKKGEMTSASPNAPPEPPRALPKEEVKKMDVETASSSQSATEGGGAKPQQSRETASEKKSEGNEKPDKKPMPTMIDKKDVDVGMAREINDVRNTPPPLPLQPRPRAPGSENSAVRDIIRENMGKTRVIVTPQVGN